MPKYTPQRVADELQKTAMGAGYYGNALYMAMGFDCVSTSDRDVLRRYITGFDTKGDFHTLQDIANKIGAIE